MRIQKGPSLIELTLNEFLNVLENEELSEILSILDALNSYADEYESEDKFYEMNDLHDEYERVVEKEDVRPEEVMTPYEEYINELEKDERLREELTEVFQCISGLDKKEIEMLVSEEMDHLKDDIVEDFTTDIDAFFDESPRSDEDNRVRNILEQFFYADVLNE